MDGVEGPLLALTLLLMVVGLLGSVLPGLPGVTLIFLSASVYAIITDFVATSYGARRFGASNWGTVGAAVGGIAGALIGLLFLGIGSLFGLILGTIAGVFLGEYLKRTRKSQQEPGSTGCDWRHASHAAGGVLVGYLASAVIQGLLGVASVIVFVLALLY